MSTEDELKRANEQPEAWNLSGRSNRLLSFSKRKKKASSYNIVRTNQSIRVSWLWSYTKLGNLGKNHKVHCWVLCYFRRKQEAHPAAERKRVYMEGNNNWQIPYELADSKIQSKKMIILMSLIDLLTNRNRVNRHSSGYDRNAGHASIV